MWSAQGQAWALKAGTCDCHSLAAHGLRPYRPALSCVMVVGVQAPHRAAKEAGAVPESCGVFISRWHHGSPAHRYALYALQFVQEVNGVPTPDLDAFVRAIGKLVRPMLAPEAPAPSSDVLCSAAAAVLPTSRRCRENRVAHHERGAPPHHTNLSSRPCSARPRALSAM